MSYHTYSVDGYGICTSAIETTLDKVKELLTYAPKFEKEIEEYFKEWDIDDPTLDDYLEYDQDYFSDIAEILRGVIKEAEDVELTYADDFDGIGYLLLCPWYPWSHVTEREKNLTIEEVDNIFRKYVNILTNKPITIEYQSVENGG